MDNHLHDRARERAETALRECKQLSREGIPQRAARLRLEMLQLLQAMWLVNGIQTRFVKRGEDGGKALDFAADMMVASSNAETALVAAIRLLEPLAASMAGDDLDSCHDSAMKNLSDEWLLDYFTLTFEDKSRGQKVEALNRALNKEIENHD